MGSLTAYDMWAFEKMARREGFETIAGLDEAGRGPLAGPVVAAAVILPDNMDTDGITDSKKLGESARDRAYDKIMESADAVGIGVVPACEIDRLNILRATHVAMKAALKDLGAAFDFLLVDGLPVSGLYDDAEFIVKGDIRSYSVAAASIIAKVTRDRIMLDLDDEYPYYGFAAHKGYGTKAHLEALDRHGPCPHHRKSFSPVGERVFQCRLPGLD